MIAELVALWRSINRRPPWWHFWNPWSGAIGGVIAGVLIALYVVLIMGWRQ